MGILVGRMVTGELGVGDEREPLHGNGLEFDERFCGDSYEYFC